jgi:hypothetical protein
MLGLKSNLLLTLLLAVLALTPRDSKGADVPIFTAGSTNAQPGEQVVIPIRVQRFSNVSFFQFSLHWNPTNATFIAVEGFGLSGLAGGSFGTTLTNAGTVTVSWDDATGGTANLPDQATLFAIRLLLVGPVGVTNSILINGTPTAPVVGNENLEESTPVLIPGALGIWVPPLYADNDADGLPDDWEFLYFGSLHAPGGEPGDDPDHDGMTNMQELLAGTFPTDAESALRVTAMQLIGPHVRINFASVAGKIYRLEHSDRATADSWTVAVDNIAGVAGVTQVWEIGGAARIKQFFRLRLVP